MTDISGLFSQNSYNISDLCNRHFINDTMLTPLENFYLNQDEPFRGCLLALRDFILKQDPGITAEWKYKLPFFYYKGKMLCYLWIHKKYRKPYIGVADGNRIDHEDLLTENRSRMKILLVEPEMDLPIDTIKYIIEAAIKLHSAR